MTVPVCSCGAPLVCTLCETCPEHCRIKDPIVGAREALEFSERNFRQDNPHTKTAREQLEEAELEMRAKKVAERSAAAVRGRARKPKPRQKPN